MTAVVLDCSVAIAWLMPDETSGLAPQVLDRVAMEGAFVPGIWSLEVANTLLIAERRKRLVPLQRVKILHTLTELPITVDTATANHAWGRTLDFAEQHKLTLYDASYLELATRLSLPLATFDKALQKAALAASVPPL